MDEDFVGKDSIAGESSRSASAVAMTDCSLLRIEQGVMLLALEKAVEVGKYVLDLCLGEKHSVPAGFGGPTLQLQREKAGAYSLDACSLG